MYVTFEKGMTRARLEGELDTWNAPEVEDYLQSLRGERTLVCLDLSGISFIDAAGLRVLERFIVDGRQGRWLEVEPEVQPNVRRVLEVTQTAGLLAA